MVKKNQKKKQARRPIDAQRRGPQGPLRTAVRTNGQLSTSYKPDHHLLDIMGKKSGTMSKLARRACELWVDPLSPGPAVIPPPISELYLTGATVSTYHPGPVNGGKFVQVKEYITATIGSGNVGFIFVRPDILGGANNFELMYSTGAYASSTLPTGVAATGVSRQSIGLEANNTRCMCLATSLILATNPGTVSSRNGTVVAYSGCANIDGLNESNLLNTYGATSYGAAVLDHDDQIVVRGLPPRNVVANNGASFTGALLGSHVDGVVGFLLHGSPGESFRIEVRAAYFAWSTIGIPRTIDPMISQEAWDCVMTCAIMLMSTSTGNTMGDNSKRAKELYGHAEKHSILGALAPVVSGLWPLIKQTAESAAPAILSALF